MRRCMRCPDELAQPGASWQDIVAHRAKTFGYRDLDYDDVLEEHRAVDLTKNETTERACSEMGA